MNYIILVAILLSIYHHIINNGLEKIFLQTFFNYNDIKRPFNIGCKNIDSHSKFNCIGMPSGHAESSAVFLTLLYYYKLIPWWGALILIIIISFQRVLINMHTPLQVIIGALLGIFYASIYKYLSFSLGFVIIFSFGILLALACVRELDKCIYGPIPSWVNEDMYPSIKTKQESPLLLKIGSIYANTIVKGITFVSWNDLETYLDVLLTRIKKSGVRYDAVVGIKTGGAIISDYISKKLGLPNYKIKFTRKEYHCNKNSNNTIDDMIKKKFQMDKTSLPDFMICEGISDNISGQNIILIDELVASGTTINLAYNYLKDEKNANIIYPACISLYSQQYKENIHINHVFNKPVLIWPWGYDN